MLMKHFTLELANLSKWWVSLFFFYDCSKHVGAFRIEIIRVYSILVGYHFNQYDSNIV